MDSEHPFDALTPELIIAAVESTGRLCDLRLMALNSYENRVYQVGIEGEAPVIVKFYRPGRWSDAGIREEHAFTLELAEAELPVVAPLVAADGETLHTYAGFRFAAYARVGGHALELGDIGPLYTLGRLLGRIHAIGATRPFTERPALTVAAHAEPAVTLIREHFIPPDLEPAYRTITSQLLARLHATLTPDAFLPLRAHGDLHPGNILDRDGMLMIVDLDDCRTAPAMQDIWMLLAGDPNERQLQLETIVEGYEEFRDFPFAELRLIEALRTLRLIHHAAWLAERWIDPAFPRHFPWFNTGRYWAEHVLQLREQLAALDEPPLRLLR